MHNKINHLDKILHQLNAETKSENKLQNNRIIDHTNKMPSSDGKVQREFKNQ